MTEKTDNRKITAKVFFEKLKSLESSKNVVFELQITNQFKKSIALSYSRNFDLNLLLEIITLLVQDKPLPKKNNAHQLKGQYFGVWECHIKPDWLLLWQEDKDRLILLLLNTATHSDFMGKRKK